MLILRLSLIATLMSFGEFNKCIEVTRNDFLYDLELDNDGCLMRCLILSGTSYGDVSGKPIYLESSRVEVISTTDHTECGQSGHCINGSCVDRMTTTLPPTKTVSLRTTTNNTPTAVTFKSATDILPTTTTTTAPATTTTVSLTTTTTTDPPTTSVPSHYTGSVHVNSGYCYGEGIGTEDCYVKVFTHYTYIQVRIEIHDIQLLMCNSNLVKFREVRV